MQDVLINARRSSAFFVPFRGYTVMQWVQNTASASYDSLQVNFRHRMGQGLTFQVAYTWGHAIDDSSDGAFLTGVDDWNNLTGGAAIGFRPQAYPAVELCLRIAVF